MARTNMSELSTIVSKYEQDVLKDWLARQLAATTLRRDFLSDAALREQSAEFLGLFRRALDAGQDIGDTEWQRVRDFLSNLSRSRARGGFAPADTASFVLSLKEPIFSRLHQELGNNTQSMSELFWQTTALLDPLALHTVDVYQKGREEIIARQQREMLELSTPVVRLWEGVLALPLIGTLDSERTQVVMENLLQQIVDTGAAIAIIDITGVPTVDTLVAQHLLKTVSAARLMGADCIISGIRPQIAQTIVHLGVELGQVTTKATLADAFAIALQRTGKAVVRVGTRKPPAIQA